jgi:hypothetical protein
MKTFIKLFWFSGLSLAMALISCQKEEYALPEPPNGGGTITNGIIGPSAMVVGFTKGIAEKANRYDYRIGGYPSELNLSYPKLTEAEWQSNLILTYMVQNVNSKDAYYVVPGKGASGAYSIYKNDKRTEYSIVFLDSRYQPAQNVDYYDMAKIIMITLAPGSGTASRSQLLAELYKAGVNIDDYHEVAHYFDLDN